MSCLRRAAAAFFRIPPLPWAECAFFREPPVKRFLCAILFIMLAAWDCHAVPITIQSFDALIDVGNDGSILVEERLMVRTVKGGHGIYREIPVVTRWRRQGRAEMNVLSVLLDGKPRPTDDIERNGNIVRVYQRDREKALAPGLHEFVLRYSMTGQVGMFDANDELTWNVTGHQWESPIGRASCEIRCPEGAGFYGQKAWLDRHGGKSGAFVAMDRRMEGGRLIMTFGTEKPVEPGWELTAAAGWEKGFVVLPEGKGDPDLLADILLGALALLLLIYFSVAWWFAGRDPEKGVIIPRFHPPMTPRGQKQGGSGPVSPAAVCYLHNKAQVTPECFGCALISMAVHKACRILGNAREGFVLKRLPGRPPFKEENAVWEVLPEAGISVDEKHGEELHEMRAAMSRQLHSDYKGMWKGNHGRGLINGLFGSIWTVLGMAASFLGISAIVGMLDGELFDTAAGFFLVFMGAGIIIVKFLRMAVQRWKSQSRVSCFILVFFCIPFLLLFWGALLYVLAEPLLAGLTYLQLVLMCLSLAIPVGFAFIMDAPSKEARALLDEIEGLAMYIGMAETDRLNLINPPDLTAEHFQELMPYAVALGLEDAWGSRFAGVLDMAAVPEKDLMLACGALSGMADAGVSAWESAQVSSESSFGGGGGGAGGGGGGGGGGGC